MQLKSSGIYKVSAMHSRVANGEVPSRPRQSNQAVTENLSPMELAASYGFERHQRILSCPLI